MGVQRKSELSFLVMECRGSLKAPLTGDATAKRCHGARVINGSTTSQRDATGERSVSLAKRGLYYSTHLAVSLTGSASEG